MACKSKAPSWAPETMRWSVELLTTAVTAALCPCMGGKAFIHCAASCLQLQLLHC